MVRQSVGLSLTGMQTRRWRRCYIRLGKSVLMSLFILLLFAAFQNGSHGNNGCTLMSAREMKTFFRDVSSDTSVFTKGNGREHIHRISKQLSGWGTENIELKAGTVLPENRDVNENFYLWQYIYRPFMADSVFKPKDRDYISCLISKYSTSHLAFPKLSGVKLVTPDIKGVSNYIAFSYPLTTEDHRYAVVQAFIPEFWVPTEYQYTHQIAILYYRKDHDKWRLFYHGGWWL